MSVYGVPSTYVAGTCIDHQTHCPQFQSHVTLVHKKRSQTIAVASRPQVPNKHKKFQTNKQKLPGSKYPTSNGQQKNHPSTSYGQAPKQQGTAVQGVHYGRERRPFPSEKKVKVPKLLSLRYARKQSQKKKAPHHFPTRIHIFPAYPCIHFQLKSAAQEQEELLVLVPSLQCPLLPGPFCSTRPSRTYNFQRTMHPLFSGCGPPSLKRRERCSAICVTWGLEWEGAQHRKTHPYYQAQHCLARFISRHQAYLSKFCAIAGRWSKGARGCCVCVERRQDRGEEPCLLDPTASLRRDPDRWDGCWAYPCPCPVRSVLFVCCVLGCCLAAAIGMVHFHTPSSRLLHAGPSKEGYFWMCINPEG